MVPNNWSINNMHDKNLIDFPFNMAEINADFHKYADTKVPMVLCLYA